MSRASTDFAAAATAAGAIGMQRFKGLGAARLQDADEIDDDVGIRAPRPRIESG